MTTAKEAKYDLTDYSDRRKAEAYLEEILSESYATWDNPETLREIDFESYFEPYLFDGGLYNSPAAEDLRISADQRNEAEEIFDRLKRSLWRDYLREKADEDGTLHVVRATTSLDDSRVPRLEATFQQDNSEAAEELAAAFEQEYSPDYSFTIWKEREDGSLVDYYTDVEPEVTLQNLS